MRSSGGTALRTDGRCKADLRRCTVGGVKAYDVDGEFCWAARGASITGGSDCRMVNCTVELTRMHKYEHRGGCGVKV